MTAVSPYTDDSDEVRPWDMQPGETDLGFEYYVMYRNAGPGRSLRAIANQVGRSEAVMRSLSSRHAWVDRCLAFDAWLDRKAQAEIASDRTAMRRRHLRLAMEAQEKIARRLETLNPDELSTRDLATWMDVAIKIERAARGEPDSKVEISGQVAIVDNMDATARRALMQEALRVLAERTGATIVQGEVVRDELEA